VEARLVNFLLERRNCPSKIATPKRNKLFVRQDASWIGLAPLPERTEANLGHAQAHIHLRVELDSLLVVF
jgi:hypothetical protein